MVSATHLPYQFSPIKHNSLFINDFFCYLLVVLLFEQLFDSKIKKIECVKSHFSNPKRFLIRSLNIFEL